MCRLSGGPGGGEGGSLAAAGAAGRRQPRFTGGETCRSGGAGWRRVESRAEECSHAPRQTCRRSERVAKRWRPRNARGASEGAGGRARGGRGRRRAARTGPAPPERVEGSPEQGMNSEQRSSPLPRCRPRSCPELYRAPPRSLGPVAPSPGRGRGRIRLLPPGPAGSCPRAGSRSRDPRGRADGPGQLAVPGAPGWTSGRQDHQGRTDEEEAKEQGRGPRAPGSLRGEDAGCWPVNLRSPKLAWQLGAMDENLLPWLIPGIN